MELKFCVAFFSGLVYHFLIKFNLFDVSPCERMRISYEVGRDSGFVSVSRQMIINYTATAKVKVTFAIVGSPFGWSSVM